MFISRLVFREVGLLTWTPRLAPIFGFINRGASLAVPPIVLYSVRPRGGIIEVTTVLAKSSVLSPHSCSRLTSLIVHRLLTPAGLAVTWDRSSSLPLWQIFKATPAPFTLSMSSTVIFLAKKHRCRGLSRVRPGPACEPGVAGVI